MANIAKYFFLQLFISGFIFGQINHSSLTYKFAGDSAATYEANMNEHISILPIKSFLVNTKNEQTSFTSLDNKSLPFKSLSIMDEATSKEIEEKESKSSSKYNWLYYVGTAAVAAIVYFAWPDKSKETKQTLTFGKPLSPK